MDLGGLVINLAIGPGLDSISPHEQELMRVCFGEVFFFCLGFLCCEVVLLVFGWGVVLFEWVCCLFFFECLGLTLYGLFFLWLCARPVGRARFRCFILAILRDLVWYVSWVCAYVGLEGGSVILVLGLILFLLLLLSMLTACVGYVVASVFRFLVVLLLCIIKILLFISFRVSGLTLLLSFVLSVHGGYVILFIFFFFVFVTLDVSFMYFSVSLRVVMCWFWVGLVSIAFDR